MDYNLLSNLSNKKRGSGEKIDLNSILTLCAKKKRISKKQKTKKDTENDENKTNQVENENTKIIIEEKEKEEKEKEENNNEKDCKEEKKEKEEEEEEEECEDSIDFSKPIKWNEINVDRLIYYSFEEIKFIANSIGIFKNGIRKHDLIDKIKSYIKMNNEIIENKIKQDNNNPFNKNTFNSLEIPIGKDGEKELLFWKVFKNKSIFKTIMSHTHIFSNSHIQFDHIISVESMLVFNQINILKEKVRLNRYLTFFSPHGPYSSTPVWPKIFSKIQDDKEFYINLFKNYKYQIPNYTINNDNKFQYIVDQLVCSNCIVGLQVLIEENLFIPTFKDLLSSIKFGMVGIIKLFLPLISDEKIEKGLSDYIRYIPLYKNDNFLESMKYLMDLVKNNQQYLDAVIKQAFDIIILKQNDSLRTLIELIGFLDSFNCWSEEFKKLAIKFKFPWHSEVSFDNNGIDSLINQFKNKIQSIKSLFSKDQLESSVYHPINYQSKESEIISNLLTIQFIVKSEVKCDYIEYFICYRGGAAAASAAEKLNVIECFQLKHLFIRNNIPYERIIFEHASYQTLLGYNSYIKLFSIKGSIYKFYYDKKYTLFGKCTNREAQTQFLDLLIQDIITSNENRLLPIFILILLVRIDDLELVKHYLSKVNKSLIVVGPNPPFNDYGVYLSELSVFDSIKSIEMFEYLFNQLDHFTFSKGMGDLKYSKHLEKLAIEKNKSILPKITFSPSIKPTVSFIKYVLERPDSYDITDILKYKPIDFYENQEEYFQCLFDLLGKHPNSILGYNGIFEYIFDFYQLRRNFTLHPLKNYCNLFKTIKKISPDCFSQRFREFGAKQLCNYYFDDMENDPFFQNGTLFLEYNQVIKFSTIRVDLKILDRVLTIYEIEYSKVNKIDQSAIKSIIFDNILKVAVCEQQIFTLEYLLSNHSHIFKKKTESKSITNNDFRNGIFTQNELRELVFLSLKGYNIKITDFLFSIITITKKQFETYSCKSIYQHYKDKFK
ncbi:hypothetical protein ACTA71_007215 [Dictyostelium dimigraforme]